MSYGLLYRDIAKNPLSLYLVSPLFARLFHVYNATTRKIG